MTLRESAQFVVAYFVLALVFGTFLFSFFDPATTFLMSETNP